MDFVEISRVAQYKKDLLQYFEDNKQDIIEDLTKSGDLTDSVKKAILQGADEFDKINNEKLKEELKKKRKKLVL